MSNKYDIHPDFETFPRLTVKFSSLVMWLINALMKVQRFFARRSFNLVVEKHHLTSADGSSFKVTTMTPYGLEKSAPALSRAFNTHSALATPAQGGRE